MRSQTQEFRGRLRLGQGLLRRGDAQGDNEAEPSGLAEGGRGQEPSRHPAPGDRQGPGPGSANRSYGRAAQGRLLGPARGAAPLIKMKLLDMSVNMGRARAVLGGPLLGQGKTD